MEVVHLQCHVGLDTLDLARLHPTARLTGLDFSEAAVAAARRLAGEVRLADRAEFVCAEVYHAGEALPGRRFDLVYTGKGALNWLPDLDRWASVVRGLLKPGGALYLAEHHPVAFVLAADRPVPVADYFGVDAVPGPGGSYEWTHPISRVITALVRAGLVLELFHEWGDTTQRELAYLVRGDDGRFRWVGPGTLPLMYSMRARLPRR
jgi:SAM-dependent methyltransferase